jgi:tetratricopeptide (TPR) repeat protein
MKRREAAVSQETALPAATLWAKKTPTYRRKDEALANGSQEKARGKMAGTTLSRARNYGSSLVLVFIVIVACLVSGGCGPDLGRLSEEAVGLVSAGRFDEALPLQERVASLDPTDAQIRVELGFNYLNHQNDAARATTAFKQVVDLQPSAKNMTFLAQAYIASGDSTSAETTLRQAIESDSHYAHSYAVLVFLLEKQGRTADAAKLRAAAKNAGVTLTADAGQEDGPDNSGAAKGDVLT